MPKLYAQAGDRVKWAGEGFIWKNEYSSLDRVQPSPSYSSPQKNLKVKNMHQNLHHYEGPDAGYPDRRRASEGLVWKFTYS